LIKGAVIYFISIDSIAFGLFISSCTQLLNYKAKMKFGLDKKTRERIEPKHGQVAICQCCETDLIPKCGQIKVHHWAHKSGFNCDHWWEHETEWHREWKNKFPIEWQEKIRFDKCNSEKHIADILIPSKELVIEFQKSPIEKIELESREKFYEKMIWVVYAEEISIKTLPIESILAEIKTLEYNFFKQWLNGFIKVPRNIEEELYYMRKQTLQNISRSPIETIKNLIKHFEKEIDNLVSQILSGLKPNSNCIDLISLRKNLFQPVFIEARTVIEKLIEENKSHDEANQNYKYSWKWRRKVWNYANFPVFLDTGKELLRIKSDLIVKKVPKDKFIAKYCFG